MLDALGLFLQETGFDVVGIWGQMAYLAKANLILMALGFVYLCGRFIFRIARSSHSVEEFRATLNRQAA